MKFILKGPLRENPYNLMRRAGYRLEKKESEELAFVRVLGIDGYPRFHLYLKIAPEKEELIFSLHLDQKRPSYKGSPAHAGEQGGEIVESEAQRIKQILQK